MPSAVTVPPHACRYVFYRGLLLCLAVLILPFAPGMTPITSEVHAHSPSFSVAHTDPRPCFDSVDLQCDPTFAGSEISPLLANSDHPKPAFGLELETPARGRLHNRPPPVV
jgi:hypothetical protein